MGPKTKMAADIRAELTVKGVLLYAVALLVGLGLAALLVRALGLSFPWWLWAIAIVGCVVLRFGQWLPNGSSNRCDEPEGPTRDSSTGDSRTHESRIHKADGRES